MARFILGLANAACETDTVTLNISGDGAFSGCVRSQTVSVVVDGILRFVELLRPGRRRPAVQAAQALGCPGCHEKPQVVTLAEEAITLMCLNKKCPKPLMLTEHFPTEAEAVDAWNEFVAPPATKQREAIRASGSRGHFKRE